MQLSLALIFGKRGGKKGGGGGSPPVITLQPSDQTVSSGGNTSFTITASGSPSPTAQWKVSTDGGSTFNNVSNGGGYSGATTGTLTITGATLGMTNYEYKCVFTNSHGSATSNPATLTVTGLAPIITGNPSDVTLALTGNVTFSASATGTPSPTAQWQVNTGSGWFNVSNGGIYIGATTPTLTITGASWLQGSYQYQCVFTNPAGSVTSSAATLTDTTPVVLVESDLGVYNDAGVTLATSGQTVEQWNDQSGSGNHLTQVTSANRPTYNISPSRLSWTVTSSYFNNPAASAVPLTQAYVVNRPAISNKNCSFAGGSSTNVGNTAEISYWFRAQDSDRTNNGKIISEFVRVTSGTQPGTTASPDGSAIGYEIVGAAHISTGRITVDAVGGWVQYFQNGALVGQVAMKNSPVTVQSPTYIGCAPYQNAPGASFYMNGDFYEGVQYSQCIADTELTSLHANLAAKYSVSLWTVNTPTPGQYLWFGFLGNDDPSQSCLQVMTGSDPASMMQIPSYFYQIYESKGVNDVGAVYLNNTYYIITDTTLPINYGAGGFTATSTLVVASCSNLINPAEWTIVSQVDYSSIGTLTACYSAKFAVDSSGSVWAAAWCSTGSISGIYLCKSTSSALTAWNAPVKLTFSAGSPIDFEIIYVPTVGYYGLASISGQKINLYSASSITGTWTQIATGDWAGWAASVESQLSLGSSPTLEAPSWCLLGNGNYRVTFEAFIGSTKYGSWYSDSTGTNISGGAWSTPVLMAGPYGMPLRNGQLMIVPTANVPPSVTIQPTNSAIVSGATTAFVSAATGTPAPTVQWQVNNGTGWVSLTDTGIYTGSTTGTLNLNAPTRSYDGYQYRAVFTNSAGVVISNSAILTVYYAPVVTVNPINVNVPVTGSTGFTAAAVGDPLPTFQWNLSIDGGSTFNPISNGGVYSGATTNALAINGATSGMTGYKYNCTVTNSQGSATTTNATLTIVPIAPIVLRALRAVTGRFSSIIGGR